MDFHYSQLTANRCQGHAERTLVSDDGITLKIPIADTNKYRSPYLWLCAQSDVRSSSKRGRKQSDVPEPTPTIFEIIPSKAQDEIIPSKAQDEIIPGKTQDEIIPGKTQDEIIPSKAQDEIIPGHGELRSIPKNRRPKKRRPKGEGSGTFITTYANEGKYGKKYPQISYQVEFGGKKRARSVPMASIYLTKDKVDLIKALDSANKPLLEILAAIGTHKAELIARDYQDYLLLNNP